MTYRLTFILIILFNYQAIACSAFFCNSDNKLLAKNFDWHSGEGYLIKNLRGQTKYAYGFRSSNVAKWTSKYGSITFNQIGKEFPYGGINEKGLVVEQLWLKNSQYKENNNKEISELEWIQYQLDNYSNINDVINHINDLTIKPNATVHFILADKTGNSAVIEFVNGEVVINKHNSKFQMITNSTLNSSNTYFENNKGINKSSRNSLDRYCILRETLTENNLTVNDAFKKLKLVEEIGENYKTYWSIVYDINKLQIHFKSYDNQNIKIISLSDFDFSITAMVEYSLVNNQNIDFKEYNIDKNDKLLSSAMKMMNLKVDEKLASIHQLNPNSVNTDSIYQSNYVDLTIEFNSKKTQGIIMYSLIRGKENYANYSGFNMGSIFATDKKTKLILYNFPKGEFALACYQDTNNDSKMDTNFLGIPKNTGFSNNKKKLFGIPPNYETAKMILDQTKTIQINIK